MRGAGTRRRRPISRRSPRRLNRRFSIAIWRPSSSRPARPAEALEHYRKAVRARPDRCASRSRRLARFSKSKGDVVGALAAYERARGDRSRRSARRRHAHACGRASRWRSCRPSIARFPAKRRVTRARHRGARSASGSSRCSRARSRGRSIITDVRDHWAQPWITPVVRAGVMDTLAELRVRAGAAGPPRRARRHGVAAAGADCRRETGGWRRSGRAHACTIARRAADPLELPGRVGGRRLRRDAARRTATSSCCVR